MDSEGITIFEHCNLGVKADEEQDIVHLAFGVTNSTILHTRRQDDLEGKVYIVPFEPDGAIALGTALIEQGQEAKQQRENGEVKPASPQDVSDEVREQRQKREQAKRDKRRPKR